MSQELFLADLADFFGNLFSPLVCGIKKTLRLCEIKKKRYQLIKNKCLLYLKAAILGFFMKILKLFSHADLAD
ncbi:hypothetical protein EAH81_17130 [Flavobacterium pectinovorum]|uniref:Uncharacterized protein n=1 Tax=Flavobacterium pectinovorum TaxID=29533 RepID=A0A502EKA4_9FLAO|nr:hypothetical protein EAH81_17130 [Flavobacterium pectinovorum]